MKIRNQNGSALITVLLVLIIFTILGLVLISASINGSKRTEIREEATIEDLDALRAITEGRAATEAFMRDNGPVLVQLSKEAYNKEIINFILEEGEKQAAIKAISPQKTTYTLDDITVKEYSKKINPIDTYTRVFRISSGNYKQILYISAMPSFLKYALGSGDTLTINGSPKINGNIYARNTLKISKQAKYIFNKQKNKILTELPSVKDYSEVNVVEDNIMLCRNDCYDENLDIVSHNWTRLLGKDIHNALDSGEIIYTSMNDSHASIDILQTFKEKLDDIGYSSFPENMNVENITKLIKDNSPDEPVSSLVKFDHQKIETNLLVQSEDTKIDIDGINLTFDPDKWLILNGDVIIDTTIDETTIQGNILITGNLEIKGNPNFNSVIYTLGDTVINNANIESVNENELLILMTNGKLDINRINVNEEKNNLKGYFYSAQKINLNDSNPNEIFAVGSILDVDGGIFSESNLEVNSLRGNANLTKARDLILTPINDVEKSRLTITNNRKLFLNQSLTKALPKVTNLDVIPDKLENSKN